MFTHVMLGSNDLDKAKTFYDAVLGELGHEPGVVDDKGRVFYFSQYGTFALTKPIDGVDASCGNGETIGFRAESPEHADAWHKAGLAAGGTAIENPPGIRENAGRKLYIAYLRDPDGHKVCAMHRLKS
ncbi:MAG: VOC family protein [Pseudohongiellaceae bacterium]